MYYQELKNREQAPSLEAICKRFHTYLELDLETTDIPVIYKKSTPDRASTVSMGKAMLKVFYENIVQTVQNVQEIIDVELPLKATLYTDDGQPTDFKLMGIIDLLIRDNNGELIIVDNKTVYSPMSQDMGSAYDSIDSLNLIMDSFEVVEKFSSH
jgi:ATP-dependent exoDNAse (exonuclease V) beta subunit